MKSRNRRKGETAFPPISGETDRVSSVSDLEEVSGSNKCVFLLSRADMEVVRACSCILILFRINDSVRIYLGECGPNPVIGSRSVMKKEYVATEMRSRRLNS